MSCFRLAVRYGEPGAPGRGRSGKRFPAGCSSCFPDRKRGRACPPEAGAGIRWLSAGRQQAAGSGQNRNGREERASMFPAGVGAASSLSRFFSSVSLCTPEKSGREGKKDRERKIAYWKGRRGRGLPGREMAGEWKGLERDKEDRVACGGKGAGSPVPQNQENGNSGLFPCRVPCRLCLNRCSRQPESYLVSFQTSSIREKRLPGGLKNASVFASLFP